MNDKAVLSLALKPKTSADQEKLGHGLARLMADDPMIRVTTDQATGEVIIAGMGELHLEIIVARLKREFGVEASVGKPQVAYKETLTMAADGHRRFVRQVLEPVMRVEVAVPKEHVGDVIGDLSSRRGQIQSQEDRGGTQIVSAHVPLFDLLGYPSDLRDRTLGRGTLVMELDHYEPCAPTDDDDGGRDSFVGSPRKPLPPLRSSRIALPEPDGDDA